MAEHLLASYNRFYKGWEILTCSWHLYTPTNGDKLSDLSLLLTPESGGWRCVTTALPRDSTAAAASYGSFKEKDSMVCLSSVCAGGIWLSKIAEPAFGTAIS